MSTHRLRSVLSVLLFLSILTGILAGCGKPQPGSGTSFIPEDPAGEEDVYTDLPHEDRGEEDEEPSGIIREDPAEQGGGSSQPPADAGEPNETSAPGGETTPPSGNDDPDPAEDPEQNTGAGNPDQGQTQDPDPNQGGAQPPEDTPNQDPPAEPEPPEEPEPPVQTTDPEPQPDPLTVYEQPKAGQVTGAAVNLRADASTGSAVVATFIGGTPVTVTGEKKDASGVVWYQLRVSDGSGATYVGYMRGDLIGFGGMSSGSTGQTDPNSGENPQLHIPDDVAVLLSGVNLSDYVRGRDVDSSGPKVDASGTLAQPVYLPADNGGPRVLVYHTHTTEAYADTCSSTKTYKSGDLNGTVAAVGTALTEALREGGVSVIHDQTVFDSNYNTAYATSRTAVEKYLNSFSSLGIVIDLHRDYAETSSGKPVASTVTVDGVDCARIMFVMSYSPEHWAENLALALKLHAALNYMYPGMSRGILLRESMYNQDLSTGSLLVEIGFGGNTLEQAKNAARCLGYAIAAVLGTLESQ